MELTLQEVQSWFVPRIKDANKGLYGKVLVIGGDYGMPGAVRLAGEAALRVGAGLVTLVTREEHIAATISGRPELLCYGLESSFELLDHLLAKATVVVLGSGLGLSAWSKQIFDCVINTSLPLIIDADGLNWLSKSKTAIGNHANWILTPHPGEASRLLGVSVSDICANRIDAVEALRAKYGGVAVLKGDGSLISSDNHPLVKCVYGNPGMASAGMGDLLSGMIAGLVAQGFDLWNAACAGVILHASAGDRASKRQGERGLLASDLLQELPQLVNKVNL